MPQSAVTRSAARLCCSVRQLLIYSSFVLVRSGTDVILQLILLFVWWVI